ncbi:MAG: c-type cytochrome domain-containing protein, partial [Planctomycetales bacterium]
MQARIIWLGLLCFACGGLALPGSASAALTAEQKKQIDEVRKGLGRVPALVGKKELDEAEKLVQESEQKLKKIVQEAGIEESNKAIAGVFKLLEQRRTALLKQKKTGHDAGGMTFEKDIAPILVARCLKCHGETKPSAGLRLDTFAGIVQGCGGKLVVRGNPNASMMLVRITAPANQRMPKREAALPADEIQKLRTWIASGAKFNGDNSKPLTELVSKEDEDKPPTPKVTGPIDIAKATGGETVSFINDIAPFMVNLCLGCHSGGGRGVRETGLSVETFERLMRGSQSGLMVIAGNLEESQLWQRVGEQNPTQMPAGQALITRTNWNNLKTW